MKIFFIISFSLVILQAYDLNSTIIDGNTTVYNTILKKLNNEKNVGHFHIILSQNKAKVKMNFQFFPKNLDYAYNNDKYLLFLAFYS